MTAVFNGDIKIGDRVIAQGKFRGKVVATEGNAQKWPYHVEDASGRRKLFNGNELELVVDDPIKAEEVRKALSSVQAEIEATEEKLEGLKLTRRVLEGFKA
jgi:hypothetical protein